MVEFLFLYRGLRVRNKDENIHRYIVGERKGKQRGKK
jgi:hypothetical protein